MYMYIAGYLVDYKGALHCFPSGEMVIRLLLLLWTGDHPAQCEICKSKGAGGKKGCRRCKMLGMVSLNSKFYYYYCETLKTRNVDFVMTMQSQSSSGDMSKPQNHKLIAVALCSLIFFSHLIGYFLATE